MSLLTFLNLVIFIVRADGTVQTGETDVASLIHQTHALKLSKSIAVSEEGEVQDLDGEVGERPPTVIGDYGVVAATHNLATQAGVSILEAGGKALDAAVAVQLMLGVVEFDRASLLGGGGLMYKAAGESPIFIDFREEAPAAYHPNVFCNNSACLTDPTCECSDGAWAKDERCSGGLSAGTPGVPGLFLRLVEDGLLTLPMDVLAAPAIKAAEEGFPMYEALHFNLNKYAHLLARDEEASKVFLNETRTGPKVAIGETFKNPGLAKALKEVFTSPEGLESAYKGDFAKRIAKASRKGVNPMTGTHGLLTKWDLKNYRAVRRAPVVWTHTDPDSGLEYTVSGAPMPFSGPLTHAITFELYGKLKKRSEDPIRRLGYFLDAQNAAFSDRNAYMADADFVKVPVNGLLKKSYANRRFQELFESSADELDEEGDDDKALEVPVAAGTFGKKDDLGSNTLDHGTSHTSIADVDGNVVSMTTTVNMAFGSRVAVPKAGMFLNNQLCDFDSEGLDDDGNVKHNAAEGGKRKRRTALGADSQTRGGKRPRSSMSPSIVESAGAPFSVLGIGAPGGSDIIGGVANVMRHIFTPDFTLEALQTATDAPRVIGKNWADRHGLLELALYDDEDVRSDLEDLGYVLRAAKQDPPYLNGETFSRVESAMISQDGKSFAGAADSLRLPACTALGAKKPE